MDYTVHGILQARILYQLSHKGSPRMLEWVAYPFSSRSSQPRNQTRVSCVAGGFFTNCAIREALFYIIVFLKSQSLAMVFSVEPPGILVAIQTH